MKFSDKPIIDGLLTVQQEQSFFLNIENHLIFLIGEAHSFNLNKLNIGETYRFIAHLENFELDEIPDFQELSPSILQVIRIGLISKINHAILTLKEHPKNTMSLGESE